MSPPQFTPGPWSLLPKDIAGIVCVVADSDKVVCELDGFSCDVSQDANLIAAAPELYEALERVWDTYGFDPSIDSSIWQDAQAALAKARGGQ